MVVRRHRCLDGTVVGGGKLSARLNRSALEIFRGETFEKLFELGQFGFARFRFRPPQHIGERSTLQHILLDIDGSFLPHGQRQRVARARVEVDEAGRAGAA